MEAERTTLMSRNGEKGSMQDELTIRRLDLFSQGHNLRSQLTRSVIVAFGYPQAFYDLCLDSFDFADDIAPAVTPSCASGTLPVHFLSLRLLRRVRSFRRGLQRFSFRLSFYLSYRLSLYVLNLFLDCEGRPGRRWRNRISSSNPVSSLDSTNVPRVLMA